ncbi:MAG: FKBP-type peptidyl-prolyl cis-trans isomerase [Novosphingobium sp.]
MSEITRVPLQPIARGSLAKLWLGVLVALLLAGGLAYAHRYQGVVVETLTAGSGPSPTAEDVVLVNYTGRLASGTEFDKGERAPIALDAVVPGFAEGLAKMQRGGKYRLEIPADKGYGAEEKRNPATGQVVIPANSDLVFDIELVDFRSRAEIMQQQQMLQQMQQMQQGGPGGPPPGAAPPP